MDKLARFAIRNRWWVIGIWIAFMVLTNGIASSLGGANYKDEFKLPHTETQTVSDLLTKAGQSGQNGIDGIMVLHAKSGDLKAAPPSVVTALQGVCVKGGSVVQIASPWGSFDCAT
jgi:RND superfamily putative drug exporter